jgi:hypothetical protein
MTQTAQSKGKRATVTRKGSRKANLVLIDVSPNPLPTRPTDWEDIKVGSLVLAWDRECEAWYEVVVINEIDGDMVRVKSRIYPKEPPVTVRRGDLALKAA